MTIPPIAFADIPSNVVDEIFEHFARGGYFNRAAIVRRFINAGHANHLAENYADSLIGHCTVVPHPVWSETFQLRAVLVAS